MCDSKEIHLPAQNFCDKWAARAKPHPAEFRGGRSLGNLPVLVLGNPDGEGMASARMVFRWPVEPVWKSCYHSNCAMRPKLHTVPDTWGAHASQGKSPCKSFMF